MTKQTYTAIIVAVYRGEYYRLKRQFPIYTFEDILPSVDAVIIVPVGLYEIVASIII